MELTFKRPGRKKLRKLDSCGNVRNFENGCGPVYSAKQLSDMLDDGELLCF